MPRITVQAESDYVEARLRGILDRLRDDRALKNEFIAFAMERGGDAGLLAGRLNAAWWKSRAPRFTPFFVLVLSEFWIARGGKAPPRGPVKTSKTAAPRAPARRRPRHR